MCGRSASDAWEMDYLGRCPSCGAKAQGEQQERQSKTPHGQAPGAAAPERVFNLRDVLPVLPTAPTPELLEFLEAAAEELAERDPEATFDGDPSRVFGWLTKWGLAAARLEGPLGDAATEGIHALIAQAELRDKAEGKVGSKVWVPSGKTGRIVDVAQQHIQETYHRKLRRESDASPRPNLSPCKVCSKSASVADLPDSDLHRALADAEAAIGPAKRSYYDALNQLQRALRALAREARKGAAE